MVFGRPRKSDSEATAATTPPLAVNVTIDDDDDVDHDANEMMGRPTPASDLIGADTSAISLDGRSLIVPDTGMEPFDDMSSLGTSKYGVGDGGGGGGANYYGASIGYIGDMRIIGRASDDNYDDVAPATAGGAASTSKRSSSRHSYINDMSYAIGADYSVQDVEGVLPPESDAGFDNSMEKDDDPSNNNNKDVGCLPTWLATAPFWLKIVIVSSTALLIGAVVLIGVGASLATGGSSSSSSSTTTTTNQNVPAGPAPTQVPNAGFPAPTPVPNTGVDGTESPIEAVPTESTMTAAPSARPPVQPPVEVNSTKPPVAGAPTEPPATIGNAPTQSPAYTELPIETAAPSTANQPSTAPTTISFYVMGGRFDGEALAQLTTDLQMLPTNNNEVLFHLGDWNSPFATSCDEASYGLNAETYQQSSVPVYFVPGDNEFNDCPNPEEAFGFWYDSLLDFETLYWPAPTWNVARQVPDYSENFSFLQSRVLFVGVNVVGGIVHDQQEWNNRHAANLAWVEQSVAAHSGSFDVLVVLGHADPDIEINDNFFNAFFALVQTYSEHVIVLHRNLGIDNWQLEPNYNEIPNLDVIVVEGSVWPPVYVEIDLANQTLSLDQGLWYSDFLATGELAFSDTAVTTGL